MGRQPLCRRVGYVPQVTSFKPTGSSIQEVKLTVEELEAIRLKDIEELELEDCAREMNVSRTTFSRILDSARKSIADALLNGKAIVIEGGNFEISAIRQFTCPLGNKWYATGEHVTSRLPQDCPRRNKQ
ncbi:MAG: DUF134 domain-containing protein [Dehalococcoidales bacterium]|nr:DUF134 domain-containing protein [Dehalococcoidales bacterium]